MALAWDSWSWLLLKINKQSTRIIIIMQWWEQLQTNNRLDLPKKLKHHEMMIKNGMDFKKLFINYESMQSLVVTVRDHIPHRLLVHLSWPLPAIMNGLLSCIREHAVQ